MPLLARTIHTPLVIDVRRGAVAEIGKILSDRRISAGGDIAVVVGPGLGTKITTLVRSQLDAADVFEVSGGALQAAQDLGTKLCQRSYDAVVAVGGGKTLDTAKWAASRYGIPMVAVATSLAHDGIASPVASLSHDGGRGSYGVQIPLAVVVDLEFVVNGPKHHTRSGIGDAISNISACADWELAHKIRDEPIDGLAVTFARTGAEALINHPGDSDEDSFLITLAEALILGGIAMSVCGSSRPCSGGCHEISHAIDELYPETASHGEQVALGALFCTWLRNEPRQFSTIAKCMTRHGLPTRPADIGLTNDQFVDAVVHAPKTRPNRYTIIEHLASTREQIKKHVADYVNTRLA